MSVINNVLKDLENKPSAFKPLDLQAVNDEQKQKFSMWVLWVFAPLLILAVASAYWYQQSSTVEASILATAEIDQPTTGSVVRAELEPSSPQVPPAPVSAAEASAPVIPVNQLVGLHINETPAFVELSFQLTQSAQSYLKQRTQDRYVFLIRNSNSQISAPVIENPWLKDIQLQQNQQHVEIQFDTAEGVLVETLHQQQQQDHYWKIRLKKSILAEPSPVIAAAPAAAEPSNKPVTVSASATPAVTPAAMAKPSPVKQDANRVKLDIKPAKLQVSDSERLKRAIAQFEAGDWAVAEIGLKSLLDSELDREARINLLSLYQYRQKPQPFQQLLTESLAQYPQDIDFILIDANQLINAKQYSTLVQRYQSTTGNNQLMSLLAASYQRLQQHDLAIDFYIQALELDPRQPKNWISLAISQEQEAAYGQALQSYQMAMRSGPLNDRLTGFVQQRIQQLNNRAQ